MGQHKRKPKPTLEQRREKERNRYNKNQQIDQEVSNVSRKFGVSRNVARRHLSVVADKIRVEDIGSRGGELPAPAPRVQSGHMTIVAAAAMMVAQ